MWGNIGSIIDKLIPVLGGLYGVFVFPKNINKKLDSIDKPEDKEKEIKKIKLVRNLGILLILLGIIEFLFNL